MENTHVRLSIGIALGVLVGVLGPALRAVAWHSGNPSGNEILEASFVADRTESGRASWTFLGLSEYSFGVSQVAETAGSADTTAQQVGRRVSGQAIATRRICFPTAGDCVTTTWLGQIGSAYTDGNTFTMDPGMRRGEFTGWLRVDGRGAACKFDVAWIATSPPRDAGSGVSGDPGSHHAEAAVNAEKAADAETSVSAPCWGAESTAEFAAGPGTLSSREDLAVDVVDRLEELHLPRVCDRIPRRIC